ncbi:MAG: ABC-three component system middle component 2 [Treponema sp.]
MNNQVFNTEFEISLRVLCILANINEALSFEKILCFDFISTYAKEFGLEEHNIQGDSNYKLSEFTARRTLITKAIQKLVLDRYVVPIITTDDLYYKVTEKGLNFNIKMNDSYFDQLKKLTLKVFKIYGSKSDEEIYREINKKIRR